jgi:precorrin-4/cobalt-precorrin-4 C11-methyltransferase
MVIPVYFIGTGPGDPELLTLKGKRIIEQSDVIVYADSLIDQKVLEWAKPDAIIFKSASLTLEETHKIISDAVREGKTVARLQSGDASLFGAIYEQMALLEEDGIEYEVIPGVSSLFASAAALKKELTVPEISQTVIITRLEGKTPVPSLENLRGLAAHRATLAILLSISMIEAVVGELLSGG